MTMNHVQSWQLLSEKYLYRCLWNVVCLCGLKTGLPTFFAVYAFIPELVWRHSGHFPKKAAHIGRVFKI